METTPARPYHALSVIPDIDAQILQALDRGESIHSLAAHYGVYKYAVQRRAYALPDYADIADCAAQLRMEKREAELENARDNVAVTRARELLSHARWLAERSCPERWGQKGTQAGGVNVQIVINDGSAPTNITHAVQAQTATE